MNYMTCTRLFVFLLVLVSALAQGSRIKKSDDPSNQKELILKYEKGYEVETTLEREVEAVCNAQLRIGYSQRSDRVEVETELVNSSCGASHGLFKLRVKWRDQDSETQKQDYEVLWSREDSDDIKETYTYSLGEGAELMSVKSRLPIRGACFCTGAVEEESSVIAE